MKSKVLTAILSLVIAFGLWMYVVTVISPNSDFTFNNVPVMLSGENILSERNLTITDYTSSVKLHMVGNRVDLNKLNSSNIGVVVNVAQIYEPGEISLGYTVAFPADVPNNAITSQDGTPGRITLRVEERLSKLVDVNVDYIGLLPEGLLYDKENAVLDTPQIRVTGPKSVVDQITQAKVEVNLDGRSESFSEAFVYTLCDEEGEPVNARLIGTDVEVVNLTLRIQWVKEITLAVRVIPGGGATETTSEISIEPRTLRISGSKTLLDDLGDVLELGTVNLNEYEKDTQLTLPIVLPEGITNETGLTEAAVDVRFPNLGTKYLTITNIQPINVPEGLEADLITQVLEICFRGPRALVENIRESDVTVIVNFENAQLGTATMRAEISLTSGFTEVGVVGSYSVSATLREPASAGK